MFGFKNSNVYVEGKGIIKCSLAIKDNKFYSFDFNETFEELDDNFIIVPGFIDEHIHGANDSDVMDASLYALENMSDKLNTYKHTFKKIDGKYYWYSSEIVK